MRACCVKQLALGAGASHTEHMNHDSAGRPRNGPRALAELRRVIAPSAPRLAARPPLSTGLPPLDAALGGGLPAGRIVELVGASGMSLALRLLAAASPRGLCAFLDPTDALDAQAAQELGVDLARLLWARVRRPDDALRAADILLRAGGFVLVVIYQCGVGSLRAPGGAWQRLVQRAEHAGTTLLVVREEPAAGSASCVTLHASPERTLWERAPGDRWLLVGQVILLSVPRSRLGRPTEPVRLVLRR